MSTEVRFYHLQRGTVEQSLPQLLAKIYSGGHKIVVKLGTPERVKAFDDLLWTFDPGSFLPHAQSGDENAAEQGILLTTEDENPNDANILILADGAVAEHMEDFDICCEIFNGLEQDALKTARSHWKDFQDKGFDTVYFQQNERGGWEKK